jgi:hypothetical protein
MPNNLYIHKNIVFKMNFKNQKIPKKTGEIIGYLTAYIVFTVAIYFLLKFLNKFPSEWNFFNAIFLTLALVLISFFIKRLLK